MKILGEKIFARDEAGNLVSRVGTLFLRTPGLVTKRGMHAMQRMMWLDEINACREAQGLPRMTREEEDLELEWSVDLVFSEDFVLIRPDPDHMDKALMADDELQKMVSKRKIRFLNTHSAKVRNALRAHGENWRMARSPISQDDMARQIESSKVAIDGYERLYYYNHATGTRYLTPGSCAGFEKLPDEALRYQMKTAQRLLSSRNRFGMPEVDLFPSTTPIDIKQSMKALDIDSLDDKALRENVRKTYLDWKMSIPADLREESVENFAWRNEMSRTLTVGPNETSVDELIQGLSPEFYRQIEWLPGARVKNGQLIFDSIWDEFIRTHDPELAPLCDHRVRLLIFDFLRLFSDIEYINIGRIAHSLARDPEVGTRRNPTYFIQFKPKASANPVAYMLRFQKWGTKEHLDDGKDLLRAMLEANEYSDYILDRRLMCQQLGMKLPVRVGFSELTEIYRGSNVQYRGTNIKTCYIVRAYEHGIASDKIPPARLRNPAFALKFAQLMGEAAALDLIVGRRSTETKENLFDKHYEVIQIGEDGLPSGLRVIDHAGSFVNYLHSFEDSVAPYANFVKRRKDFVSDVKLFADTYVEAFERKLGEVQKEYRMRKVAFDELFVHRPVDVGGSGAYRWAKTLERLAQCDPQAVAAILRTAIEA